MRRTVVLYLLAGSLFTAALWGIARAARSPGDAVVASREEAPAAGAREVEPCRVTGCSGQICSDEEVITTCEYRPEYACYKTAFCEPDREGACGWRIDSELRTCLDRFRLP